MRYMIMGSEIVCVVVVQYGAGLLYGWPGFVLSAMITLCINSIGREGPLCGKSNPYK